MFVDFFDIDRMSYVYNYLPFVPSVFLLESLSEASSSFPYSKRLCTLVLIDIALRSGLLLVISTEDGSTRKRTV